MIGNLRIVALWSVVSALCLGLDLRWPQTPLGALLGFVLAFAGLAAAVIESARVAGRDRLARIEGWHVALFTVVLLAGAQYTPWPAIAAWMAGVAWLVGGSRLGAAIGHGVESASYVWPLVIVALGADIWSVTAPEGITHQVLVERDTAPALAELIVLQLAVPGVGVSPLLGIGDILFSGLLLGAVDALGLSMRRAVAGLVVGFALCLVALVLLAIPIPALPLLGVCTAVALGASVRPRLRELALAVGMVVGVLVAGRLL